MAQKDIRSVLLEERSFPPSKEFAAKVRLTAADADALYKKAASDYLGFWADLARSELVWDKPFTQTLDDSRAPNFRWFADGRLNVSYNCLDVHLAERGHQTALIFEGEPGDTRRLSYRELHAEVCRCANALKAQGVRAGDRVVIYMPLIPEVVVAMHACARIGAVHSVVFGGFSAASLKDRIEDAGAKLLITADGGRRGGHIIELKAAARPGTAAGCPTIERVIVYRRTGAPVPMDVQRDVWWHDVVEGQSPVCEPWQLTPSIRSFFCTRQARRASPRAFSIQAPGTCSAQSSPRNGSSICARTTCSGARRTWAGSPGTAMSPTVRLQRAPRSSCMRAPRLSGWGTLVEDLPNARRDHLLHRADGHPRPDEARRRAAGSDTICRVCGSWAASASPSIRRRGSGTSV